MSRQPQRTSAGPFEALGRLDAILDGFPFKAAHDHSAAEAMLLSAIRRSRSMAERCSASDGYSAPPEAATFPRATSRVSRRSTWRKTARMTSRRSLPTAHTSTSQSS
jgi:hypothetical protein